MATDFESDLDLGVDEGAQDENMTLTDREVSIARGEDPETAGELEEDATEEADGMEAVEEEDGASEAEGTDADSSWVNDDVKKLAESYGIGEEGLSANFQNESEFRRFAAMLSKYGVEKQGEQTVAEQNTEEAVEPAQEKAHEEAHDEAHDGAPAALDPKWFEENGYDEQTVKIVDTLVKSEALVQQLTDRIGKLEGMLEESGKQQETALLERAIDDVGGRFGSSGSLSDEQRAARDKLLEAAEVVKQSLEKRGETTVTAATLLRRAELLAFGDEILAEESARAKEALADKVKKQSAKRRPVGRNTKPPVRRELPGEAEDPVKAIANSPEVLEFWNSLED